VAQPNPPVLPNAPVADTPKLKLPEKFANLPGFRRGTESANYVAGRQVAGLRQKRPMHRTCSGAAREE